MTRGLTFSIGARNNLSRRPAWGPPSRP